MPAALFVAFIVVPLAELYVISRVGGWIGLPATLVILLAVSVAGAWLVKREGRAAWRRFREALGARVPTVEVVDGALVLIGGTLLLTPGFLTDAVGLALVIPPSRALANRAVRSRVRHSFGLGPARGTPRRVRATEDPIDVEVVDIRRNGPGPPAD
ncbi:MAG: FxsA family protein [Nitriliruptorales bacterium]|nr:FxsA family protein [Nitriliruptorales bacterium]